MARAPEHPRLPDTLPLAVAPLTVPDTLSGPPQLAPRTFIDTPETLTLNEPESEIPPLPDPPSNDTLTEPPLLTVTEIEALTPADKPPVALAVRLAEPE